MKSIICPKCKKQFISKLKRDVLGFPEYTCPSCQNIIEKPLTDGYRIIYWLLGISAWYKLIFDNADLHLKEIQVDLGFYIGRLILLILFLVIPFTVLWIDYKRKRITKAVI